jgi:hypothetical protein
MMFGALLIIVVFAFPRGMAGGFAAVVQALKRQLSKRANHVAAGDNGEERHTTLITRRQRDGEDTPC